jgi:hypothetical protein
LREEFEVIVTLLMAAILAASVMFLVRFLAAMHEEVNGHDCPVEAVPSKFTQWNIEIQGSDSPGVKRAIPRDELQAEQ